MAVPSIWTVDPERRTKAMAILAAPIKRAPMDRPIKISTKLWPLLFFIYIIINKKRPEGAFCRFESSLPRIGILPLRGRKNQAPVLEGAAQSAADGKLEGVPDGGRGFDVHGSRGRSNFSPRQVQRK